MLETRLVCEYRWAKAVPERHRKAARHAAQRTDFKRDLYSERIVLYLPVSRVSCLGVLTSRPLPVEISRLGDLRARPARPHHQVRTTEVPGPATSNGPAAVTRSCCS